MKICFRRSFFGNTQNSEIPQAPIFTKDIFAGMPYTIGRFTYGKPTIFEWGEGAKLEIGSFCSIADGVEIFLGGNHRVDWITTYPFNILCRAFPNARDITGHPSTKGDVIIGSDVWIGRSATIMSGIKIGHGAVIGAHSVVTKNVNPYEIVAGNPARVQRIRFDTRTVDKLLELQWWDWPIEKINEEVHHLCDSNADYFNNYNI